MVRDLLVIKNGTNLNEDQGRMDKVPESIGAGSTPGRVYPGKKMSGQLGNKRVMVKTEIIYANTESNIIVLTGSLSGKTGNILKVETISKTQF